MQKEGQMMSESQSRLQSVVDIALKAIAILGGATTFVMMFWGVLDVIMPLFGYYVPATVAYTEILNAIALSLPLAYVTWKGNHINVDIVINKLKGKYKLLTELGALIIVFLFSSLLAWQLSARALKSVADWEFDQLTISVYLFPGRIALALGFVGTSLVVMSQIIRKLRQ
jgi:TRAP-type transport system small permease protein